MGSRWLHRPASPASVSNDQSARPSATLDEARELKFFDIRSFKFRIYDDKPHESTLGFHIDPGPMEGKVIAKTDEAIIVKTGRAEFAVLDRHLVSQEPEEGAKVQVQPYARRRFDGLRADTPEERTEHASDGTPYTVKTHVLGSAPAKLPAPELRCPELKELVHQLEQLPAPDGF
ncbi:hypothetical protein HL670_03373 [Serratia plymuthica]|uniref:hypothetical protein n=1 Tax=Serratia plymuthica TaxID=82996 RepID=UPI001598D1BF|nr:hypothetical protein HL670_03373 [Serratia plymuthica]